MVTALNMGVFAGKFFFFLIIFAGSEDGEGLGILKSNHSVLPSFDGLV